MRVLTQPQPLSQCSAKAPQVEVDNIVDLADLTRYFRRELGMSNRTARFNAREVYRNKDVAKGLLPSGWFEAIYPPKAGLRSTSRRSAVLSISQYAHQLRTLMTPAEHAAWLMAGGDRA